MNRGERSCENFGHCTEESQSMSNCNVDCELYLWDGTTHPDSITAKERREQYEYKRALVKKQLAACTHDCGRVNGMCADCGKLMKGGE